MSNKNKKKDDLKRCPFCNGKFIIKEIHSTLSKTRYILYHKEPFKARDKRCPLITNYYYNKEEAIDAWNHRA